MNACGADDTLMKEHISSISNLQARTKSNTKRIDKNENDIEKLENTYSILMKLESQIDNLNSKIDESMNNVHRKVDTQIRQSENNAKEIINALLLNKKTIQDRVLDASIYLIMIIIFWTIGEFFKAGGTL